MVSGVDPGGYNSIRVYQYVDFYQLHCTNLHCWQPGSLVYIEIV